MTRLCLYFLGPPRIEIAEQPVSMTRRKSLALLVYLAVTGQEQRRDTLATLFWPESAQSRARGALRRELSKLGTRLGNYWLDTTRETVRLRQDAAIWLDVAAFEQHLVAELAAEAASIDQLTRAIALYRGDFLTGFSLSGCPDFDEWQLYQAEALRRRYASALDTLIRLYDKQGDYAAAIPHAARRLALDPLYEPGQRALMRLYALSGQQAAALRQYEEFTHLLAVEMGAPPETETAELAEAIRQRRIAPAAPQGPMLEVAESKPPATAPANLSPPTSSPDSSPPYILPAPVTSLVGRAEEIEKVGELLAQPDCRLLTITGAGGIGKTRLALAAAEQAQPAFADGVCFVSLAGTNAPEFVLPAIVDALRLSADPGGDIKERLFRFLRDKDLLLMLDNFEHLLDGADLLLKLLQSAPDLKLLVTSRDRLNLVGEWVFPLQGLPYPPNPALDSAPPTGSAGHTPDDSPEYPALELFLRRARQVHPDFSPRTERAGMAAICRLVEGMPLGIELAATWVHTLSCAEIAAELAHSIDFLTTTLRDVSPQHRSLRAVFDRSWQLLAEEEQRVLAQLSVFRGTFSRAAAEAVTRTPPALLARLVDRSLLRRQQTLFGQSRFDMHELLRQFAAEKLAADEESVSTQEIQRRHCAYYSNFLGQLTWPLEWEGDGRSLQQDQETQQQIQAELDNIRTAWEWASEQRDTVAVQHMMDSLLHYYEQSALREEGIQIFEHALAAFEDNRPHHNGLVGSLLLRKGWLMHEQHHRHREAYEILDRSLAYLRKAHADSSVQSPHNATGTDRTIAIDIGFALALLGDVISGMGENSRGVKLLEESGVHLRALKYWPGLGYALFERGKVEIRRGRMSMAERVLNEAAALLEHRNEYLYLLTIFMLSNVYSLQGRYREGEEYLLRALEGLSQINPYQVTVAYALRNLGDLVASTGNFAQAKQYFAQARARFEYSGLGWNVDIALVWGPGTVARLEGDLPEAERLLTQALATARRIHFEERIVVNLHNLAALRYEQERYAEAMALLSEALPVARQSDSRSGLARVLCRLGYTAAVLDQPTATAYFREALEIARQEQIHRVTLDAIAGVATLQARRDPSKHAAGLADWVLTQSAADFETRRTAQQLSIALATPDSLDSAPAQSFPACGASLVEVVTQLLDTTLQAE